MKKTTLTLALCLLSTIVLASASDFPWLVDLPLVDSKTTPPDERGRFQVIELRYDERDDEHLRVVQTWQEEGGREWMVAEQVMDAGTVLVGIQPDQRRPVIEAALEAEGGRVSRWLGDKGAIVHFSDPDIDTISKKITTLCSKRKFFRYAEPDEIVGAQTFTTGQNWNLTGSNNSNKFIPENTDSILTNGQDFKSSEISELAWHLKKSETGIEEAWEITRGEGSVIAVIDSGFWFNHPRLIGNIWTNSDEWTSNGVDDDHNDFVDDHHGWDFADDDNDPMFPLDVEKAPHGVYVTNPIAADEWSYIPGVANRAKFMLLKVGRNSSEYKKSDKSFYISAIYYAADNGADVIVCSFAFNKHTNSLLDAVAYATEKDCLIVASGGNNPDFEMNGGKYDAYPAGYAHYNYLVISAGGKDQFDNWYGSWGEAITLAAPAVDVPFALDEETTGFSNGTSISAPIVGASAALVKSANSTFSGFQAKEYLIQYSIPTPLFDLFCDTGKSLYTLHAVRAAARGTIKFPKKFITISEGQPLALAVYRNAAFGPATVDYHIVPVSASPGQDYEPVTGTLQWGYKNGVVVKPANGIITDWDVHMGDRTIDIPILEDAQLEDDETFMVVLSNATGASLDPQNNVAFVTISDDVTKSYLQFKSTNFAIEEGDEIEISVERTGNSQGALSAVVHWEPCANQATYNQDYFLENKVLIWADADMEPKSFKVKATPDAIAESSEYAHLVLTDIQGGAQVGENDLASVRIKPNYAHGMIRFTQATVEVSDVSDEWIQLDLYIERVGGSVGLIGIPIQTMETNPVSAQKGVDFGSLMYFAFWGDAKAGVEKIPITIFNDGALEYDETFTVEFIEEEIIGNPVIGEPSKVTVTIKGELQGNLQNQPILPAPPDPPKPVQLEIQTN